MASPRVWYLYLRLWISALKIWYLHSKQLLCQTKHWVSGKILRSKKSINIWTSKVIGLVAVTIGLIAWGLGELGRGIADDIRVAALRCPGVFVILFVQGAMEGLIVYLATHVRDAMDGVLIYMAAGHEDVSQSGVRMAHKQEVVKEKEEQKEVGKQELVQGKTQMETRHPFAACTNSSRVDSRSYASVAATYLKISLDEDSNRNWSNEHGNLSPGFGPPHRSIQLCRPTISPSESRPSPFSARLHSNTPKGPAAPGSDSGVSSLTSSHAILTPCSTASASSDRNNVMHIPSSTTCLGGLRIYTPSSTTSSSLTENHTPGSSDTATWSDGWPKHHSRPPGVEKVPHDQYLVCLTHGNIGTGTEPDDLDDRIGFGAAHVDWTYTGQFTSKGSSSICTPSTNSSDASLAADVDTPSASSCSSGNAIATPSVSGSFSGGMRAPLSVSNADSGEESIPGTPTSTSSAGSESTVIYTPPRMHDLDYEDALARNTPDSTSSSSSGSSSTGVDTPNP